MRIINNDVAAPLTMADCVRMREAAFNNAANRGPKRQPEYGFHSVCIEVAWRRCAPPSRCDEDLPALIRLC
jgi:hypothetical protein